MKNNKKNILLVVVCLFILSCEKQQASSFELIWDYQYKESAEALSLAKTAPRIEMNNIILSPDGILSVLNIEDGKLIWEYNFSENVYIKSDEFILDEQFIFFKDNTNHEVYSFDKNDGSLLWTNQIPDEVHQFSNDGIDDEFIYLSGDEAEIFKYAKNGSYIAEYDLIEYGINTDARSIRILDNQLIFSQRWRFTEDCPDGYCGRIMSIDKETEEVLWEYVTDNGGYIFEPILLEDEIIYAGVTDGPGEFVALNANNGEVIWKTLGVIGQSYSLTDSMVLINDGISVLALDKFTGKELWNTGLAFGGGDGASNVGYLNGYVYHAHSGRLYILEGNTGEIVHTEERSPDGSPFQLLAVGDDKVFIQTFNTLYAYTAWE